MLAGSVLGELIVARALLQLLLLNLAPPFPKTLDKIIDSLLTVQEGILLALPIGAERLGLLSGLLEREAFLIQLSALVVVFVDEVYPQSPQSFGYLLMVAKYKQAQFNPTQLTLLISGGGYIC